MVTGFLRSVLFSWRLRDIAADCFVREGLRAVFRHLQPDIRIYGGIWPYGHCRMDGCYGTVTGSVWLQEMPPVSTCGLQTGLLRPVLAFVSMKGVLRLYEAYTALQGHVVFLRKGWGTGLSGMPLWRPVGFILTFFSCACCFYGWERFLPVWAVYGVWNGCMQKWGTVRCSL